MIRFTQVGNVNRECTRFGTLMVMLNVLSHHPKKLDQFSFTVDFTILEKSMVAVNNPVGHFS